ncbi:hypothetical protein FB45DRAFT_932649 [Roridomyces roridus]|uniref:F-box domain-containing protein n=1 Tax=Roridomyces roridus TaxID=1738132 RepID=A0AAD7BDZ4_9AGAR|nr:hypothetical protein FB45DRAFT_932649 [Roridomyces roridus]
MSAPAFPTELDEQIIDNLHLDKPALAVCALVCQSWMYSSRYHLFGSLVLRRDAWGRLIQLLESPRVTFVPYIRDLVVSGSDSEDNTYLNQHIPQLPNFPSLARLRIAHVAWADLSPSTTESFLRAFSATTNLALHFVTFNTTREPVELVSGLPRLDQISIVATFLDDSSPDFDAHPPVAHALTDVSFRTGLGSGESYGTFVSWLNSSSSRIHTLRLGALRAATLPTVSQLLHSLGPNLETLDLAFIYQVTAAEIDTHLDLSSNTHLRRLGIHVSLRRFHLVRGPMNAPWAVLAAVRSPLATLTIELTVDAVVVLDDMDWNCLNTTLLGGEQFRGLRRLEFVVVVHLIEGDEEGAVEAGIRARVPELDARGIVEVVQKNPIWGEGF